MMLEQILYNLKTLGAKECYQVNNKVYTYKHVYKYVCNMYNYLLENNTKKRPVIVYGHKEAYMIVSFLACSLAGITYIPIDNSTPAQRVNSIIEQTTPNLIIGDFKSRSVKNLSTSEIMQIIEADDYKQIENIYLNQNDTYYIIFTSGSTGVPKGVEITYNNLDCCIDWLKSIADINQGVVLNQANFSFDLSVADIYLSLVTGSKHYILERDVQKNFNLLFNSLSISDSSLAVMTPSFADLLLVDRAFNQKLMPNLKKILFCGETLLYSTVKKIYDRFDNIQIINLYGPTECTVAVTYYNVPKNIEQNKTISLGKPKYDVKIHIVDENLNTLPDRQTGEILILGKSVGKGYLGSNKNNSRFITFNGEKAYLTGDLGYIKNGNLYYKCRKDKQIKYNGYRIEPDDIESNLYKLKYIEKAIVLAKKKQDLKITKLLAFVKLIDGVDKTPIEIKTDLLTMIPKYMCPNIKIISSFPLNKNGKCDKSKLLEEF